MTPKTHANSAEISPNTRSNFTHLLQGHALAQPQTAALQIGQRVLTYQRLEDGVGRAATWLHQQGVKPKDIVALQMREPVSLALAMLGLMRLGATPMPLSPSATQHQVEDFVREASVQSLLVDTTADSIATYTWLAFNENMLRQVTPLSNLACETPEGPCLLITGSGSTGKPRLIPVTHAQMRARAALLTQIYRLQAGDRLMVASPLHFATPVYRLWAALSAGVTGVSWDQQGVLGDAVEQLQPNLLHLSVLHAEQLLAHHERQPSFNLTSVRVVSIGASAVSESLRQRLRAQLGAALHINYGTNETLTVAFAYPSDLDKATGVVGRPPQGVRVEVMDTDNQPLGPGQIGQVRVCSPAQIAGYMGGSDPERFREGWFYPGDLAQWTPDGQLVHCGRADQLMIMNGINIYPAEIERVISTHPAVREVLAFPFAHRVAQDLPVCVVVLNEAITASSDDIQSYAQVRLGLKTPRHVVILPAIPRNEQGKPDRVQLNQQVRQSLLSQGPSKSTQASTGTSQNRQRHQRSRRMPMTFSPPNAPRADLVRPWRILLTGSTTQAPADMPAGKTAASEAVTAWLTELLLIAAELLRMVRVPVFDALVPYRVQPLEASANANQASWQAVLEVPVLDHMPTDALEPVMAVAIQSALRIASWAQQQAQGSSNHANTQAEFFARTESEANTHLAKLAPTAGKSTLNVLAACHALGVPWADLGGDIYQLGWGARGRRIDRSTTDHDSAMGMRVARNKALTGRLLRYAGLPAAEHEMVHAVAQALNVGNRIGWPVVIKPVDAERGEGVRVDVQPADLAAAFAAAQKHSPTRKVLLERQVHGVCHRIFIAQNQLLYAVRRLPIGVYGNGADSITQLVNDAFAVELTKAPWRRSPLKPIDELAHQELARQGLLPGSVPAAGQFVALRRIESTAWGGVDEDVTAVIHPENLRIALEASRLCGLDVAGVDLISPDISQPWYKNGAVINEVNYAPLLGEGVISRAHLAQYLARLLGGNGRIAVEVFVGDAAATTAARKKATLLHQQGKVVVVTSHHWTFWGHGQQLMLAVDGLYARTRALILSAKVEALILVVQNDELSYSGLPLEGVDRVEIVNQNLACRAPLVSAEHQNNLLQWLAAWRFG